MVPHRLHSRILLSPGTEIQGAFHHEEHAAFAPLAQALGPVCRPNKFGNELVPVLQRSNVRSGSPFI